MWGEDGNGPRLISWLILRNPACDCQPECGYIPIAFGYFGPNYQWPLSVRSQRFHIAIEEIHAVIERLHSHAFVPAVGANVVRVNRDS